MGTLTVRENLNFSAALRLSTYVTQKEKQQKVNKLIEELGLGRVADSRVRRLENKGTKHKAPSETENKIISHIQIGLGHLNIFATILRYLFIGQMKVWYTYCTLQFTIFISFMDTIKLLL